MPRLFIVVFLLVFNLPACSPPPTRTESPDVTDAPIATDLSDWRTLPLVNARTGESFTLSDFAGKIVFVEIMATWCGNCRLQMTNVRDARAQLGEQDYVYIGLSVETYLSAGDLAAYAENAGFDWTFAVLTPEVMAALGDAFGRTITNPPATPHFIIYPDGSVSELHTGNITSTQDLIEQLSSGA
jgi:thiol-disulfide isomerase/thioredoxin